MAIKINMDKSKYESFMKCIQIFFKRASDVSIVNGKIYQFNDGKRYLFDIDLEEIVGKNTVYLSNFEFKYPLLEIFKTQFSAVNLEITDKKYIFSDKYSKVEFIIPDPRVMMIKPANEGSSIVTKYISSNYDNVILECKIEPFILERISQAKKSLLTDKISIICDSGEAQIAMMHGDNNNRSQMFKVLECECAENYNGVVQFPLDPFQLNTNDLNVTLYGHEDDSDLAVLKAQTKIGIDPQIDIRMASVQSFIKKK